MTKSQGYTLIGFVAFVISNTETDGILLKVMWAALGVMNLLLALKKDK